jgi:hypothetical protein
MSDNLVGEVWHQSEPNVWGPAWKNVGGAVGYGDKLISKFRDLIEVIRTTSGNASLLIYNLR